MSISGDQIVALRKSLGLTQQEMADQLSYSRTYLSDIEVGKVHPSQRFLESIKKKFGVSLDSLVHRYLGEWVEYIATHPAYSETEHFFFIYAFTDEELLEGERDLLKDLSNRDHIVIDTQNMKTFADMVAAITGSDVPGKQAQKELSSFLRQKEHMYILVKNLSRSKVTKKGATLRRLIQGASMQTVIVLDKPSFLENNQEELYPYALSTVVAKRNFTLT